MFAFYKESTASDSRKKYLKKISIITERRPSVLIFIRPASWGLQALGIRPKKEGRVILCA